MTLFSRNCHLCRNGSVSRLACVSHARAAKDVTDGSTQSDANGDADRDIAKGGAECRADARSECNSHDHDTSVATGHGDIKED